jgi:Fic family protein
MQIISGAMGKEKVHYEAVKPELVKVEMDMFLDWFNTESSLDLVLKAAIAHFWFIIVHPFDDGNGRIARALSDMLLARAEHSSERFYSLSSLILIERKQYYAVLQKVQHSKGDITPWLGWFLNCLKNAMLATENATQRIIKKAEFWKLHANTPINERQRLIINKLFDGFEGKLTSTKWALIAKCSQDTALRDIGDLMQQGILTRQEAGGRSTCYELVLPRP